MESAPSIPYYTSAPNLENRGKQRVILVSSHFYLIFRQQVENIEGDPAAEAE